VLAYAQQEERSHIVDKLQLLFEKPVRCDSEYKSSYHGAVVSGLVVHKALGEEDSKLAPRAAVARAVAVGLVEFFDREAEIFCGRVVAEIVCGHVEAEIVCAEGSLAPGIFAEGAESADGLEIAARGAHAAGIDGEAVNVCEEVIVDLEAAIAFVEVIFDREAAIAFVEVIDREEVIAFEVANVALELVCLDGPTRSDDLGHRLRVVCRQCHVFQVLVHVLLQVYHVRARHPVGVLQKCHRFCLLVNIALVGDPVGRNGCLQSLEFHSVQHLHNHLQKNFHRQR